MDKRLLSQPDMKEIVESQVQALLDDGIAEKIPPEEMTPPHSGQRRQKLSGIYPLSLLKRLVKSLVIVMTPEPCQMVLV